VRAFRAVNHDPPIEDDMRSPWDAGRRPERQRDEATYRAVSAFDTFERAAHKARERNLGPYVAELEIPDDLERTYRPDIGHLDLYGTTPEQLLSYVLGVRSVDEIG
jgi:hypothetical protein